MSVYDLETSLKMSIQTTNDGALVEFEDVVQLEEENQFDVYIRKQSGAKKLALTFNLKLSDKYKTCFVLKLAHFEARDILYFHNDEVEPHHFGLTECKANKSNTGIILDVVGSHYHVIIDAVKPLAEPIQIHNTLCTHEGQMWFYPSPYKWLYNPQVIPLYLGKRVGAINRTPFM